MIAEKYLIQNSGTWKTENLDSAQQGFRRLSNLYVKWNEGYDDVRTQIT